MTYLELRQALPKASKKQIAAALGVHPITVYRWDCGRNGLVVADRLTRLLWLGWLTVDPVNGFLKAQLGLPPTAPLKPGPKFRLKWQKDSYQRLRKEK